MTDATTYTGPGTENLDQVQELLGEAGFLGDDTGKSDVSILGTRDASPEDAAEGFRQAAEKINERNKKSRDYAPQSDPDEGDDGVDQVNYQSREIPQDLTSPQGIEHRKHWLANQVHDLHLAFNNGYINQHQLQAGLQAAEGHAQTIQNAELQMREREIADREYWSRAHEHIATHVPGWEQPGERVQIATRLRNFFINRGIPGEILDQITHPDLLIAGHNIMKEFNKLSKREATRLKQIRDRRSEARSLGNRDGALGPKPLNRFEQLSEVHKILGGR